MSELHVDSLSPNDHALLSRFNVVLNAALNIAYEEERTKDPTLDMERFFQVQSTALQLSLATALLNQCNVAAHKAEKQTGKTLKADWIPTAAKELADLCTSQIKQHITDISK